LKRLVLRFSILCTQEADHMSTTEIAASNSLADLAARIRAEHEGVLAAMKRGIVHAMAAGDLLLEAKDQLDHGQWMPWLEANCGMSGRTARRYMHFAKHRGAIEAKMASSANLTVQGAIDLFAAPDAPETKSRIDDIADLSIPQLVQLKLRRIDTRIRMHPTGLDLPPDLSFEQWKDVGVVLAQLLVPDDGSARQGKKTPASAGEDEAADPEDDPEDERERIMAEGRRLIERVWAADRRVHQEVENHFKAMREFGEELNEMPRRDRIDFLKGLSFDDRKMVRHWGRMANDQFLFQRCVLLARAGIAEATA
jgi:Protein of unknown function (DUF3102)